MHKYDNYVYMSICEITFALFKETHYSTYSSYCSNMRNFLLCGDISRDRKEHLSKIYELIGVFYSMSGKDIGKYISDFFVDEKYLIFERPMRLFKEFFPDLQKIF